MFFFRLKNYADWFGLITLLGQANRNHWQSSFFFFHRRIFGEWRNTHFLQHSNAVEWKLRQIEKVSGEKKTWKILRAHIAEPHLFIQSNLSIFKLFSFSVFPSPRVCFNKRCKVSQKDICKIPIFMTLLMWPTVLDTDISFDLYISSGSKSILFKIEVGLMICRF